MKISKIFITLILLLIISCSSKIDTYQSLSEEMLDVFEEITLIIDNVKDEVSAQESLKKLDKLNDKMNDLTNRMSELGDLDASAREFLESSNYEERFTTVLSKLFQSTVSISEKSYGKDLMDALTNILNPNK